MTERERSQPGSQPPPAVRAATTRSAYKRNLPHLQRRHSTLFVTFSTRAHLMLPDDVRAPILGHCLHDHGARLQMHAAVVMPDHVHLLFTPMSDQHGEPFPLAGIMGGIKGASAHAVNRLLGRRGRLWEAESFDRIVRSSEKLREKAEYICANPVRAGLAANPDEWPWLWREWIEGADVRDREPSEAPQPGAVIRNELGAAVNRNEPGRQ